jgi:hypothetical protein
MNRRFGCLVCATPRLVTAQLQDPTPELLFQRIRVRAALSRIRLPLRITSGEMAKACIYFRRIEVYEWPLIGTSPGAFPSHLM